MEPDETGKQKLRRSVLELVTSVPMERDKIVQQLKIGRSERALLDQVLEELLREGECAYRPDPCAEEVPEERQPIGINPIKYFGPIPPFGGKDRS